MDAGIDGNGPVLRVREVAAMLQVTEETVCGYIRRGELPASGLGSDRLGRPAPPYAILQQDLQRFLLGRRVAEGAQAERKHRPSRSARGSRRRSRSRRGQRHTPLVEP